MEQIECSETSAYKIQTPENYPEESIQHSEHGESLKSWMLLVFSVPDHKRKNPVSDSGKRGKEDGETPFNARSYIFW